MRGPADTHTIRVRHAVLLGAAEAYASPLLDREEPCSLCGCASPAAETAECDRPDCPLEGSGRG